MAILTQPAALGFRAEGVVVKPLSDTSLCFQTCVIMRKDAKASWIVAVRPSCQHEKGKPGAAALTGKASPVRTLPRPRLFVPAAEASGTKVVYVSLAETGR